MDQIDQMDQMDELVVENQILKEVVSNGTKLIEALETKLIESNKEKQDLQKEMQVLIYKTQLAHIESNRKNWVIGTIVFTISIVSVLALTHSVISLLFD
jgi:hypothetical protein